jgi:hypothetical protein
MVKADLPEVLVTDWRKLPPFATTVISDDLEYSSSDNRTISLYPDGGRQ